ncbi:recombinase family protein [Streptomyces halobius]|uniref:recombinase family protein n=1 Tax=Streptomyces halobius TaxID=2879846 RepID=UPI00200FAF3B|nr:recombinase family protein [Streptomyces halobius]
MDDDRKFCELRGWDVVLVAVDDGVSGSVRPADREGFGEILANLDKVDVVVARGVDRFSRVTAHFAELVEMLTSAGSTLADVQGQCDLTSPYGRFVTTIMVAFAEMERETIRSRILRSRVALRQQGRWLGGAAPYGFVIVPHPDGGKYLDVDPDEAPQVLEELIDRLIEGHHLTNEIERLNNSPHLSPMDYRRAKAGTWHPPMVRSDWTYAPLYELLRSPVLRGYRVEGKRKDRRVVRDADGEPIRVGPALVSDEKWFALQAALDANATNPRRPRRKATLLLHVAQCRLCEDPTLYYNSREYGYDLKRPKPESAPQTKRMDVYNCMAAKSKKLRETGPCPGVTVNAEKVEAMVEEWFLENFGGAEYMERVRVGGADHVAEIKELETDVEELSARTASLRGAALDAILSQLQGRSDRLAELKARPIEPERWEKRPTGQSVASKWGAGDTAERRLLLLEFGVQVTVDPAYGARTWRPERVTIAAAPDTLTLRAELEALADDAL